MKINTTRTHPFVHSIKRAPLCFLLLKDNHSQSIVMSVLMFTFTAHHLHSSFFLFHPVYCNTSFITFDRKTVSQFYSPHYLVLSVTFMCVTWLLWFWATPLWELHECVQNELVWGGKKTGNMRWIHLFHEVATQKQSFLPTHTTRPELISVPDVKHWAVQRWRIF